MSKSATAKSDSCACERCVASCRNQPGWFLPGEAEKAAELLGLDFEEFKRRYLVIEYWVGGACVYAPRKTYQPDGCVTAKWGDGLTDGDCIFLDGNERCRIHEAKPAECRETFSCRTEPSLERDIIQQAWADEGYPLGEG